MQGALARPRVPPRPAQQPAPRREERGRRVFRSPQGFPLGVLGARDPLRRLRRCDPTGRGPLTNLFFPPRGRPSAEPGGEAVSPHGLVRGLQSFGLCSGLKGPIQRGRAGLPPGGPNPGSPGRKSSVGWARPRRESHGAPGPRSWLNRQGTPGRNRAWSPHGNLESNSDQERPQKAGKGGKFESFEKYSRFRRGRSCSAGAAGRLRSPRSAPAVRRRP